VQLRKLRFDGEDGVRVELDVVVMACHSHSYVASMSIAASECLTGGSMCVAATSRRGNVPICHSQHSDAHLLPVPIVSGDDLIHLTPM